MPALMFVFVSVNSSLHTYVWFQACKTEIFFSLSLSPPHPLPVLHKTHTHIVGFDCKCSIQSWSFVETNGIRYCTNGVHVVPVEKIVLGKKVICQHWLMANGIFKNLKSLISYRTLPGDKDLVVNIVE